MKALGEAKKILGI